MEFTCQRLPIHADYQPNALILSHEFKREDSTTPNLYGYLGDNSGHAPLDGPN